MSCREKEGGRKHSWILDLESGYKGGGPKQVLRHQMFTFGFHECFRLRSFAATVTSPSAPKATSRSRVGSRWPLWALQPCTVQSHSQFASIRPIKTKPMGTERELKISPCRSVNTTGFRWSLHFESRRRDQACQSRRRQPRARQHTLEERIVSKGQGSLKCGW